MILLSLYLSLAAILHQSSGEAPPNDVARLMTSNTDQQTEIIDKHNDLRRIVKPSASNMLKMVWSAKIAENALRSANKCTLKHTPRAERIIDGVECGENLFMSSNPRTWSSGIQGWFDEEKDFKFGFGPTSEGAQVGHYTQVVWYKSYLCGCAYAYCPSQPTYKHYYVCQYSPGGNIDGRQYEPYTIGTPCGKCPNACDNGLCTNPCTQNDVYSNCPEQTKKWGCDSDLKNSCGASCGCTTEII